MAKLNKRQAKKQAKKQLQKSLVSKGYKQKEISKFSVTKLQETYTKSIAQEKEQKKRDKYNKSLDLLDRKRNILRAFDFPEDKLKTTYLRKVKMTDLKALQEGNENAVSREKYPFLFDGYGFDFNKVYHFPNGKGLHIRYLDYSWENRLEDLLLQFNKKPDNELITYLEGIVTQKRTYNPKAPNHGVGTSSGRAGTFEHALCDAETARIMYNMDNEKLMSSYDNEIMKRYHTGSSKYYTTLFENGQPILTTVTGHEILVIFNAVLYNVTENDRHSKYKALYDNVVGAIPDFRDILPNPTMQPK